MLPDGRYELEKSARQSHCFNSREGSSKSHPAVRHVLCDCRDKASARILIPDIDIRRPLGPCSTLDSGTSDPSSLISDLLCRR